MVRTIFAQPDAAYVERRLKVVAATVKRPFGVVNEMLLDAAGELTAFRYFRAHHWQKIWSTNSLSVNRLPMLPDAHMT